LTTSHKDASELDAHTVYVFSLLPAETQLTILEAERYKWSSIPVVTGAGDLSRWIRPRVCVCELDPAVRLGSVSESGGASVSKDKKKKHRGPCPKSGVDLLHDPLLNKGTAFSEHERIRHGLRGLLPAHVESIEEQLTRALGHFRGKANDLERHIYLTGLHDRNTTLFYRLLIDNIEEMMPIVYTPTVGQACQLYGNIFRRARGLFISSLDRGSVADVLGNWHSDEVKVIVVTDGERILGLGDLGANGMGIPVGKLVLYCACAGIPPASTLPVTLDVGTNNQALLDDPLYLGIRRRRLRGAEYDELVEEFVQAAVGRWPKVLIQFEDFANPNSFRLLEKYRDSICTFNDDIQGTAAVTLAGLYSALRITGGRLSDQRLLFLGAGGAGIGIGDMIVCAMKEEGLSEEDARQRCWFVDSSGLVVKSREALQSHKLRFAHDIKPATDIVSAGRAMNPTGIIGVSGIGGAFTQEVVEEMARINERPIVFALSNPTSMAECTAEEAYRWSAGRAVFASGSPFDPVELDGKTLVPGQGNNAYIFPGLGLGVVASGAKHVSEKMFAEAARVLAGEVTEEDLGRSQIFPSLSKIREVSLVIAKAVAQVAFDSGLATVPEPEDLGEFIKEVTFEPQYQRLA
jgi:malate dehydrogenase (oxaloacetate-decarboxylating)(NADP+)